MNPNPVHVKSFNNKAINRDLTTVKTLLYNGRQYKSATVILAGDMNARNVEVAFIMERMNSNPIDVKLFNNMAIYRDFTTVKTLLQNEQDKSASVI